MTHSKEADVRRAFGQAVRQFRLKRGISQEKLAEMAEIHRTYIGDVERGTRNISLLNMSKIAAALNVPLSRILVETERQSSSSSSAKHVDG